MARHDLAGNTPAERLIDPTSRFDPIAAGDSQVGLQANQEPNAEQRAISALIGRPGLAAGLRRAGFQPLASPRLRRPFPRRVISLDLPHFSEFAPHGFAVNFQVSG